MSAVSLEKRVAALEGQMAQLLNGNKPDDRKKDWRRTIGMFAGDDIMREICDNALAIREEDRRRSLADFEAQERRSE